MIFSPEYEILSPFCTQKYENLPENIKNFLSPEYMRYGVVNEMDRDGENVNISFVSSLNYMLRPELKDMSIEEITRNAVTLENFISHMILKNYHVHNHVDKIKNTKKMQSINKELVEKFKIGDITPNIIQKIADIFEINLLIFDLENSNKYFYWTHGIKYPQFNPFKDIYIMSHLNGNYEPLMTNNNVMKKKEKINMYINILSNITNFITQKEITIGIHTFMYINKWKMNVNQYAKIINHFFPRRKILFIENNK